MSDDGQLQKAVVEELNGEPGVTSAHIGVAVDDGVVTLTGHVTSLAEKHAAEAAARRVRGVQAVAEEIEVILGPDAKRSDEDIAAAAAGRLVWDVSVPSGSVAVTVEKGWLTLTGAVDWHYQKAAAEQDLQRLVGVVGLTNDIKIKSKVLASTISDDIMHALHRSWFFDPRTINVTSDDGIVHLTGTVHSLHDRQVAASTAWAAPGVIEVKNDIRIV
jgi:osmotically-inducible protein OsmY